MGNHLRFSFFIFILINSLQANDCKETFLKKYSEIQLYKAEQIAKKMQQACPNANECNFDEVMKQAFDMIYLDLVNPISLPSHIIRKSTHIFNNFALLFTPPVAIYYFFPNAPDALKQILSVISMFVTQRLLGRWDYPWGYPFESKIEQASYWWWGSNSRFSKINKHLQETTRLETSQVGHLKLNYQSYLFPIKQELLDWQKENNPGTKTEILKRVVKRFANSVLDCKELFGGLNLNDSSVLRDVRDLFPEDLSNFKNATKENVLLRLEFFKQFVPLLHQYIHELHKDVIDEKLDRDEVVAFGTAVLIQWLYGKDNSVLEDLKLLISTN